MEIRLLIGIGYHEFAPPFTDFDWVGHHISPSRIFQPYAQLDPLRSLILLMQAIGPSMRRILYALDIIFMSDEPLPRNLLFRPTSFQTSQLPFDENVPLAVEGPHHPAAILILEPFYEML